MISLNNWDVSATFDKANKNPVYAFSSSPGKTGQIYTARLNQTDNIYEEYVGARACTKDYNGMSGGYAAIYEKEQARRAKGWYVERKEINSSEYKILIRGIAWSDCKYASTSGDGYVKGTLKINNNNGWRITKVEKCSVSGSNKGQDTYCTVWDDEISFAAGSTCGGCCACSDSGGLDIEITVNKQRSATKAVHNPVPTPTLIPTPVKLLSLVGEWNFEEGKGETAEDTSGNGNTGIIHGTTWTTGKIGSTLQFNGTNDYVDVGNAKSLNIANAITIEAWIRPSSIANYPSIVNNNTSGYNLQIGTTPGDGRLVLAKQGVAYLVKAKTVLDTNRWYHIAATYDGKTAKIYINGKLDAQNKANHSFDSTANTLIGYYSGEDTYFSGKIDDLRIYDYALTSDQIDGDYNQGTINQL